MATAAEIDIAEVKDLAKCPVDVIFRGAPITPISDTDYTEKIQQSTKPSVVIFYVNRDSRSQKLATLIRYLAIHFHEKINFYAYRVSKKNPIRNAVASAMQQHYSLDRIPGTFVYVRENEENFLKKGMFNKPKIKEYMIPSMFLWETYYNTAVKYIQNSSLIKNRAKRTS
ncbi:MAG: hypothetical protein JRJ85_06920 [Deltaproteobacteria bacterium]|nr:hypothetical protein [Deltaproteobacteria bacterium]